MSFSALVFEDQMVAAAPKNSSSINNFVQMVFLMNFHFINFFLVFDVSDINMKHRWTQFQSELFNGNAPAPSSTAALVVAVALDWFAALVMVRRAAAAAAACVATTATVGATHRSRLWLRLEKAKEPGRDFFIMFFGCSGTYLVLPDADSSSSSACRFLLPHVQLTHTGFGFGFGLKKNLRKVLPYVGI